jgi:hypothetical protein
METPKSRHKVSEDSSSLPGVKASPQGGVIRYDNSDNERTLVAQIFSLEPETYSFAAHRF